MNSKNHSVNGIECCFKLAKISKKQKLKTREREITKKNRIHLSIYKPLVHPTTHTQGHPYAITITHHNCRKKKTKKIKKKNL